MAHKGIRELSSQSMSSVALGQLGFAMLINNNVTTGYRASDYGVEYFTELKAIEGVGTLKARAYQAGAGTTSRQVQNAFSDDFVQQRAITSSSDEWMEYDALNILRPQLANGTSIYGAFDQVTLSGYSYILAYLGPKIT